MATIPPGDKRFVEATTQTSPLIETDLESLRLLLRGDSVVDWHRLQMRNEADVDRFLRVNEFDPKNKRDLQRLESLRDEAIEYLRDKFGFRIPNEVAFDVPAKDLFLMASEDGPHQRQACMILKVMHIVHHLAGRELSFRLPISNDEIFALLEQKVIRVVEEIKAAGHPISEFHWSRKQRGSLITKLLAKQSTLAANVYDKLRFRLVVKDRANLLPLLTELVHRLVPFNYVVPGESVNGILPVELSELANLAVGGQETEPPKTKDISANEFSSSEYRIINFVADLPIRLEDHLCQIGDPQEFGPVVFVFTEFQVADESTVAKNELGESSHARYKARQLAQVKQRLAHGLAKD